MTQERRGPLTRLRHAFLSRLLIKTCGGLEEAAGACRVGKSQLANFQDSERVQDPERCQFMPADVIADLEAYCGQPIYSRELFEARPTAIDPETMLEEALSGMKTMADVVAQVSAAVADGVVTPRERKDLEGTLAVLIGVLQRLSCGNSDVKTSDVERDD